MRGDGHGLGDLSVAEHLDAVVAALHEAVRAERRLVDLRAGAEGLEVAHADLGGDRRERVREAALGEAALQRRLPALEVRLEPARAGVLALLTATGGLAEAGARRRGRGASSSGWRRRASPACSACQPLSISSTRTRCITFLTAPRNDGVLLTTTVLPGPRRPRPWTVARSAVLLPDRALDLRHAKLRLHGHPQPVRRLASPAARSSAHGLLFDDRRRSACRACRRPARRSAAT